MLYFIFHGGIMKKLTALLLCAIIVLSSLSLCVSAAATVSGSGSPDNIVGLNRPDEFRAYLIREFASCPEKVNIRDFLIPYSEENGQAICEFIWYEVPELFHIHGVSFHYELGLITDIIPTYRCTPDEYAYMLAASEMAAREMIAGTENLSDEDKVLIIHDRLCDACEYDYDGNNGLVAFTMYGALVDGIAVCDGYAHAFLYMMRLLGMECSICASMELAHAWNIVKVDGVRYHVDVTWDDFTLFGCNAHENLLRSTDGIISTGHNATDFDRTPSDTRYDKAYWQCSESSFQLVGSDIYYIDNDKAELVRIRNGEHEVVADVSATWFANASQYWTGCYTRLASADGRIFFSSPKAVKEYIPDGRVVTLLTLDLPSMDEGVISVYGMRELGGYLLFDVNVAPDRRASARKDIGFALTYTHARGDANGDGKVSAKDVASVLKFAAGYDPMPIDRLSADVNNDGEVNAKDVAVLMRCVTGWETIPADDVR